jgi:hypothetical protein
MNSARKSYFSRLILMALLASVTVRAELKPETVAAFDHYVKAAEDEMDKHKGFRDFLWLDRQDPKEKSMVWLGQSTIVPLTTLDHGQEIEVPGGAIQHWLGLTFLEKASLDKVSMALLNFNEYFHMIPLQIMESKTTKHEGDNYDGFLRLYKKQVSSVVLNVTENAKYTQIDPMRAVIACHSTHIGEVERPRKKKTYDQDVRSRQRRLRRNRNDYARAPQWRDLRQIPLLERLSKFPQRAGSGLYRRIGKYLPAPQVSQGSGYSALAVSLISCPGSPPACRIRAAVVS